MRIASITAGAAGMFCGSCMKDNALAAALTAQGHNCWLMPTFTPLTLDEPDQSTGRVFLGGVNVYLDEFSLFRWVPKPLRNWLDRPGILRWASRFAGIDDYERLGSLTLSMLRGDHGRQRREFDQLLNFLAAEVKPDIVLLSNVLLSALAPLVRRRLGVPVVATLQGDDIFLDALNPSQRHDALALILENATHIAGFIATSRYYADHMAKFLGVDRGRIEVVWPGINVSHYAESVSQPPGMVVGYFARIAPEKGLHILAEAFELLRKMPGCGETRLRISGWLGKQHRGYRDDVLGRLHSAGLGSFVEYIPCPTLSDKIGFLKSLCILSVPTVYREPKGLYALEAMACGVPTVLPDHGAFSEWIAATRGGVLVPPGNPVALAEAIAKLLTKPAEREQLARSGQVASRQQFTDTRMAHETARVLQKHIGGHLS